MQTENSRDPRGANGLHFSLRFSISFVISAVVVLTCLTLGLTLYAAMSDSVRNTMRLRLHDALGIAAQSIDAEKLKKLKAPEDENTLAYARLTAQLRSIRSSMTGVKYVYTFRKNGRGGLEFVLDAEENEDLKSRIGQQMLPEHITAAMRRVFDGTRPDVESDITDDEYGSWLSGYAPILDNEGHAVGAVGMDISAENVLKSERAFLFSIGGISLLIIATLLPAVLFIAKRISKPLQGIAQEMAGISRLDLNPQAREASMIKEINQIGHAIDHMKSGLRSFKKYVPADLVKKLISKGIDAQVGFEKRQELTILFSDLSGFTSMSDKMDPENLSQVMNTYLSEMADIAEEYGGTLDKFIGDGILIYFGDLESRGVKQDALQCCKMAIAMQKKMGELNALWSSILQEPLRLRIGITTGLAAIGNFGSKSRINYTAIGSAVNLASRLESNAPKGGILVSRQTKTLLEDELPFEAAGSIKLKGFEEAVEAHILTF